MGQAALRRAAPPSLMSIEYTVAAYCEWNHWIAIIPAMVCYRTNDTVGMAMTYSSIAPRICAVTIIVCSFISAVPKASATCGDHLGSRERAVFSEAITDQWMSGFDGHSKTPWPCRGPECRRGPGAPLPVAPPIISSTNRQDFVVTEATWHSTARVTCLVRSPCGLRELSGHGQRLERPPKMV